MGRGDINFKRTIVLLIAAAATIPVALLTIPVSRYFFGIVEGNAEREGQLVATRSAENVKASIQLMLKHAEALSSDSDIHRSIQSLLFVERADLILREFLDANSAPQAIHLLDLEGHVVTAAPIDAATLDLPAHIKTSALASLQDAGDSTKIEIFSDETYVRHIQKLSTRKFPLPSQTSPHFFSMWVPVTGLLGKDTGVLIITSTADSLGAIASANVGRARVRLLAADSIIATSSPPDLQAGDFRVAISEVPVLPAANFNFPGLRLAIEEPHSERYAEVETAIWSLATISIAIILNLAFLGFFVGRHFTRPIDAVRSLAAQYAEGNYEAKGQPTGFQEFSELMETMEDMGTKIKANIDAIRDKERLGAELARAQVAFEIDTLKKQMSPHFLFNSLNSVAAMIDIEAPIAKGMLTKLADLYRLILDSTKTATIPLRRELEIVTLYLDLEQVRFGRRLTYSITSDADLNHPFPGLLLQTLIENAIKHGVAKSREGGHVELTIAKAPEDAGYSVTLANTGAPLKINRNGEQGTGLTNTIKRLDLLYGTTHDFSIQTSDDGKTLVHFFFT